jgi:AcrR family transcriptional regulator
MPAETARLTPSRSSSASERGRETKERLLDAAERLFGERGFEGASMRAVTQEAGTSVSAANYHFGSKEALLRATLLRRVEPVNRRRIAWLDALEREAQGKPLPLERILEAFLRPLFEERAARAEGPAEYRQVAARLYSDPPELVASKRFPGRSPIEAPWRSGSPSSSWSARWCT